jgi:hypothetical protein
MKDCQRRTSSVSVLVPIIMIDIFTVGLNLEAFAEKEQVIS